MGQLYRKNRIRLVISRAEKLVFVSSAAKIANTDLNLAEDPELFCSAVKQESVLWYSNGRLCARFRLYIANTSSKQAVVLNKQVDSRAMVTVPCYLTKCSMINNTCH